MVIRNGGGRPKRFEISKAAVLTCATPESDQCVDSIYLVGLKLYDFARTEMDIESQTR